MIHKELRCYLIQRMILWFQAYFLFIFLLNINFNCVMLSVLASSVVDRGCEHDLVKARTIKLVFAASPLRMYHVEVRSKRMVNRSMKIQIYTLSTLIQWDWGVYFYLLCGKSTLYVPSTSINNHNNVKWN